MASNTGQVTRLNAGQIVRMKAGSKKYEILTNVGTVTQFRDGKISDVGDVMLVEKIYTNAKQGNEASPEELSVAFEMDDIKDIMEKIVRDGDLQYTAAERAEMMSRKTNEICYYINQTYVQPTTKLPHPVERLKTAFKDNNIRVDLNIDTSRQAEDAVKKLRGKLMFTEVVALQGTLEVKHHLVGKVEGIIKHFNPTSSDYGAIGATYGFALSQQRFNQLTEALRGPTDGDYQLKIVGGGVQEETQTKKSRKKGKKGKR